MQKFDFRLKKHHFFIGLMLVAGILFGTTMGAFFALTLDLPQIRELETYRPPAVTRILSQDNIMLSELFHQRRHPCVSEGNAGSSKNRPAHHGRP